MSTCRVQKNEKKQIGFQEYFNCQGAPIPSILDLIRRRILSPDEWEGYEREVMKHPTPEDLQKAKEFARRILSQARKSQGKIFKIDVVYDGRFNVETPQPGILYLYERPLSLLPFPLFRSAYVKARSQEP